MGNQLHVVLGASGAVGRAVVHSLKEKGLPVRAVGRSTSLSGVENIKADIMDLGQTQTALQGASHVYICVGLPYQSKVWATQWEVLMQNVIIAASRINAAIIYLDNMYMYGPAPLDNPITENHPQQPSSVKGKARKRTTDLLLEAIRLGKVEGVIGRASDFYGPFASNSPFYIAFLERMLQGKAPQTLMDPNMKHCYANTSDLGKALVGLALDPTTYGETWHLPVGPLITVHEMTELFNQTLGTQYKVVVLSSTMRKILKWIIPTLKEVDEMFYQFEKPYEFSFDKFKMHFPDFEVTPYEKGVAEMIQSFKSARD